MKKREPVRAPFVSILGDLEIEISKTSTGEDDYVQVRSPAAFPVNIVLIAKHVTVADRRGK